MKTPPRLLRVLFAWLGYSSVHWAAGRWRRALFWDAALLAFVLLALYLPVWLVLVVGVAQIVDAALLRPAQERSTGAYAIAALVAFCIGTLVSLTARGFYVEAFKIPSGAMIPTLQVGDHIFVAKYARTPARGDVIVFRYPKEPDKDFVKRAIAVGGDTVEYRDGRLWLDGQAIERRHVDGSCEYEDYLEDVERWETHSCDAWDETLDGRTYRIYLDSMRHEPPWGPVTIPPGHVFVMGDNRDNSFDSRAWGTVPPELIRGTARTIWWSSGPSGVRWDRLERRIR